MIPKRPGRPKARGLPDLDPALQEGMHRISARDPMFFGWHLGRLRQARGQTVEQQAAALGLSPSALAVLALCKVPRPDRHAADLAAVAKHVGLDAGALAGLLRDAADERTSP